MATATLDPALKQKLELPSMWHVMLKNDDYTSFEFVIIVLMEVFRYSGEKAEDIAQEVHDNGRASAGLFTRDIAETKATQVLKAAAEAGLPLQAYIEKAVM